MNFLNVLLGLSRFIPAVGESNTIKLLNPVHLLPAFVVSVCRHVEFLGEGHDDVVEGFWLF